MSESENPTSDNPESKENRIANEKRFSFAGKEVVYSTPRENQIVELGPGGGDLLAYPDVRKYLASLEARYFGIEKDNSYANMLISITSGMGEENDRWARAVKGDYFDALTYPNPETADEIWMKNSLAVNDQTVDRASIIAFNTLKPGGQVVFADILSPHPPEVRNIIVDGFRKKGFEVTTVNLTEDQNHPLMNVAKRQGFNPTNHLAFYAKKPQVEKKE